MSETTMNEQLLGQQWSMGPITADLLPHPEQAQQALLQVSLGGLGSDLDDLDPARAAQALRWLLRLNADGLVQQGCIVGLDEDEGLVLLQPVSEAQWGSPAALESVVQASLERGLELAELWVQLLLAGDPQSPN
jgi:hypothetical protein